MATWFDRLTGLKRWGSTAILSEPSDTQANTGFAFLGQAPPPTGLHDALFQYKDDADLWLYRLIKSVTDAANLTLGEATYTSLRDALSRFVGNAVTNVTTSAVTLTAANIGKVLVTPAPGGTTITLPAANALGGTPFVLEFFCGFTANSCTIQRAGTNIFEGGGTSYNIAAGDRLRLISDGIGGWYIASETPFSQRTVGNPGYCRLPGGLIFQWMRNQTIATDGSGAATKTVTFPVAFTTAVYGYSWTHTNEAAPNNAGRIVASTPTLTQQTIYLGNGIPSDPSGAAVSGFVIGK